MTRGLFAAMANMVPCVAAILGLTGLWAVLSVLHVFPPSIFPAPLEVALSIGPEWAEGRLIQDIIASLFRVTSGFGLAVLMGIPVGLWLGQRSLPRRAFLPIINFFRSLSPLSWIPFAILWFGVGDTPAIFLIFMAAFFQIVLTTLAAVANIPSVHFRVAREYGLSSLELFWHVTLPAVMPQVITAIRVTAGLSWMVVVAAEMIAGQDGLGFAIWDARNGLRMDLLVMEMIIIGTIGMGLDRLLVLLEKMPSVRWGYEH